MATPVAGLEFGVADCGGSSWLHPDVGIHHRRPSCSDHAVRSGIAADPFAPDQNDHTRVTNRPRSQDLGAVHALARALLPAAAFAAAMQD